MPYLVYNYLLFILISLAFACYVSCYVSCLNHRLKFHFHPSCDLYQSEVVVQVGAWVFCKTAQKNLEK